MVRFGSAERRRSAVEPVEVGKEGAQPLGQVGVLGEQGLPIRDGAGLDLLHVLGDDRVERVSRRRDRFVGGKIPPGRYVLAGGTDPGRRRGREVGGGERAPTRTPPHAILYDNLCA